MEPQSPLTRALSPLLFLLAAATSAASLFLELPLPTALPPAAAATGLLLALALANTRWILTNWRTILSTLAILILLAEPLLPGSYLPAAAFLLALPLLAKPSKPARITAASILTLSLWFIAAPHLIEQWPFIALIQTAAALGIALLAALCCITLLLPKLATALAVLGAAAAALLAAMNHMPPSTQFNITIVAFLLAVIVATIAVAALVTFLVIKALENMAANPHRSFAFLVPILAAPGFLAANAILDHYPETQNSVVTTAAFAAALTCLGAWALILTMARLGRTTSNRLLAANIAWKFLRSQRQVLTWKTRWTLALRSTLSSRAPFSLSSLIHTTLPLLIAAAGIPAASLFAEPTLASVVQMASALLGLALVAVLSFRSCNITCLVARLITAIALATWISRCALFSPLASNRILLALSLAAMALPLLIIAFRGATLFVMSRIAATGLPPHLDPALAPPTTTRLAHGVGPSVFFSLVGVAVGVWALILVLSVMTGFQSELQNRIANAKDHIMVKVPLGSNSLKDPMGLADKITTIPGVLSASPYVDGEVMMAGEINVSPTVTIRGVDPTRKGLDFLAPMIVSGYLDGLLHPESLIPFPGFQPIPDMLLDPELFSPDEISLMEEMLAEGELAQEQHQKDENGLMEEMLAEGELAEEQPEMPAPDLTLEQDQPAESNQGQNDGHEPQLDSGQDQDDGQEPLMVDGLLVMPDPDPDAPPLQRQEVEPGEEIALLPTIVIGRELARALSARPGSVVQVISPDGDVGPMGVQPRARPFRVAAVFQSEMYDYDLKTAFVLLSEAQRFFNFGNDITHIDVRLESTNLTDIVAASIRELAEAEPLEILTWQQMNTNLFSALKLEQFVMFIVLGFIIIIASFSISSSLVLIIRKRVSAIAILRTIGAGPRQIMVVFLLIGLSAGLFGTFSGLLLGLLTSGVVERIGLTLPQEYYVREIPVEIQAWKVAAIALASVFVTAIAAIYPGRVAGKVGIIEGLKDER